MNTDELIVGLAKDAKPVKPAMPPRVLLATWCLVGSVYLIAGVLLIGARPDLSSRWLEPGFLVHAAIVLAMTLLAGAAAFSASFPDRQRRPMIWASSLALAAWLGWMLSGLAMATGPDEALGWKCLRNIAVLGIPLGMLMYILLKTAAPLKIGMVGWLGTLAAGAAADFATRFICRNDHAAHALIWHFVPVMAMAGMGLLLGRVVLRWETIARR